MFSLSTPSAIVLLLGTNDIEVDIPVDAIGRNFEKILAGNQGTQHGGAYRSLPHVPQVLRKKNAQPKRFRQSMLTMKQ